MVDYIGPAEDFPLLGFGIDLLMKEQNIEYADCYCAGISAEQMAQAGWSERKEDCPNIIPNYLTPRSMKIRNTITSHQTRNIL